MNPLIELRNFGQSIWFDNIRRGLVTSGELERMLTEYGLTGVTSNPTIFERAIAGSTDYNEAISRLVHEDRNEEEILKTLFAEDIRMAADVFAPVYESSKGFDGYVSIEVSPSLAYEREATINEVRSLHPLVGRPNVMVKVPGTSQGVEAVEVLIGEGFNINVTLLFSISRYEEVAWAYIKGLEKRLQEGKPVSGISSVASFFVSRVDTLTDKLLEERIEGTSSKDEKLLLKGLMGKTAVANAKLAYRKYEEIFFSDRFKKLQKEGAAPQRLLWASTGTKNPSYSDIKYVEELIGKGTVNTMPLNTLNAFRDHGSVKPTLTEDIDEAEKVFEGLKSLGVDINWITEKLEEDGVKSFSDSFDSLAQCIASKKAALIAGVRKVEFSIKGFEQEIDEALEELNKKEFSKRLWAKDPTIWKEDEENKEWITKGLGWLTVPEAMEGEVDELNSFAGHIKDEGFKHVVLLGMGGSSLAPLVFSEVFGPGPGFPELKVLDSTDPDAVKGIEGSVDLEKTLFIVSSKSGSTIEPMSFFEYFFEKLKGLKGEKAGENFLAITDPNTSLKELADRNNFRRTFLNPSDIGGRFSALSFFGLVPAALTGIDISRILEHAGRVIEATEPCVNARENPAVTLGATLGVLAKKGRDKVTFFLSEKNSSFGLWIEQLVAESTGKEGKGLVPISGEPPGDVDAYGSDRVFVWIRIGEEDGETEGKLKELEEAGHPVVRINLKDPYELGGEFFRWEVATAAAGEMLGINPFDQPDVESAKKRTRALLEKLSKKEPLVISGVTVEGENLKLSFTESTVEKIPALSSTDSPEKAVKQFMDLVKQGDYFGILAYFEPEGRNFKDVFKNIRRKLRDATMAATQFGFGPRYLHSTGQLHKGGANNGIFLVLVHDSADKVRIPGKPYTFSELELAQGLGDAETLDSKGRRVAIFNLKDTGEETLKEVESLIINAVKSTVT